MLSNRVWQERKEAEPHVTWGITGGMIRNTENLIAEWKIDLDIFYLKVAVAR